MKKIVRVTENDIEKLVRKIIKEERVNELGDSDFTEKRVINNSNMLKPGIAKLGGEDYIVVLDSKGFVVGNGPKVKGLDRNEICRISQKLISDWESEVMGESDRGDYTNIRPVTFCGR